MRMRQSLAQFEADFREEAADSVVRRDDLRQRAVVRAQARRVDRKHKAGTARFALLCLAILATTVVVTWVMFQVLAYLAG